MADIAPDRTVGVRRFDRKARPQLLRDSALLGGIGSLILCAAPAFAAEECGAPVAGTVTCTAAGNPYPAGISYAPATDLHLVTEPDVNVVGSINVKGSALTRVTNDGTIVTTGSGTALAPGAIGVAVFTKGSAVVDGSGTISTSGSFAHGIEAIGREDSSVTISGPVTTSGDYSLGIYSVAGGVATVTTTGNVRTSGAGATGIYAYSYTGGATINAVNVATVGDDANAVYAYTTGSGATVVKTTGTVSTAGTGSIGIYAGSADGDTIVDAADVATTGADATGIYSTSSAGNATVRVSGSVSTRGDRSIGIYAGAYYGTATVNAVNVTTAGVDAPGVYASAVGGDAVVSTTGTVSTSGARSIGIYSYASGGTATVDAVRVSTSGADSPGIVAYGDGGAVVTSGQVATTGTASSAILAYSAGGGITINSGSATAGGSGGFGIGALGAGPVSVTSGTASALDQPAIAAFSGGDATSVTVTGPTTAMQSAAIAIGGGTSASLVVGAGATVSGGSGGVLMTSATGSSVTNAGHISSGTGYALAIDGGPSTVTNSGTIDGRVLLAAAGSNMLVNAGTFIARGDSSFGGTADVFRNTGTLSLLPGSLAAGTVTFTGLESFANSGTVSLLNGHSGDTFILPGTFTGSGGSTLALDLAGGPAAPTIDRLTVAGALTGGTILVPNGLAANGGLVNSAIVFATGGAGSSATAFALAGGSQTVGFIRYTVLASTSGATTSYALVGAPGDAVFRPLKLNEGTQSLWYKSADAWSAHMAGLRDAKWNGADAGPGRGIWGQSYGEANLRKSSQTTSAFGVGRAIGTSYKQDSFGGQIGTDIGQGGPSGAITFGVTGGYINSELGFRSSSDRARYNVVNAGAYVSFVAGGVFANALAKYDYAWVWTRGGEGAYADKFHGQSYGAQGELGVRLGSDSFYAEPVVTGAYVRTNLGSIHALGSTLNFDNLDGLRGKAGLRLGSSRALARGGKLVLYVGGNVVHEFKGRDGLTFSSGANSVGFRNDRIPTYGEGKAGFNVVAGGVTGFIEGIGNYSHDYKGGGGRVGLLIKL